MIKLIVGNKGAGKTKTLMNMANEAAKTTKGHVVCVEMGMKMTYTLDHAVRLIDIEEYKVVGFDAFYGFIVGILAGDYDITEMFIDGTLKVGGKKYDEFGAMIQKLNATIPESANITFTVSCDEEQLPAEITSFIIK